MISLSSTSALAASLRQARSIMICAYMLPPGAIEAGLIAAARSGAHVDVWLSGRPYRDADGRFAAYNEATLARLRVAGVHTHEVTALGSLHLKAAILDGRAYLDDRNFAASGILIADTSRADARAIAAMMHGAASAGRSELALGKDAALAREADLINRAAAGDIVRASTEAVGDCVVTRALCDAAGRGARVHVHVQRSDVAGNLYDQREVARLLAAGVTVDETPTADKYALVGNRAWIGSANATPAARAQSDWGIVTSSAQILARLRRIDLSL